MLGEESTELVQAADRLAHLTLMQLSDDPKCKDPHKKAIQITSMAGQMLQATYAGEESLSSILAETAQLLDTLAGSGGNA